MRVNRLAVGIVLLMAACGGPGAGSEVAGSEDPCALATSEMIRGAFGGTVADGEAGQARNCQFAIEGGSAPVVYVYHYGSADAWDGVRSGFDDNRGGTTDIGGLGDAAYHPGDMGPSELVVSAGGVIFSVSTGSLGGDNQSSDADLLALAQAIAADLGG